MSDSYDLIVVGHGGAGLSAAVSYIHHAEGQGRKPRVLVLESAPEEESGGATRWTTSRFRACADYSLDPFFVGRVQEVSKGLADVDYFRTLEAETANSIRFLEDHGVELLHFDPPAAMSVEHEVAPNGGGHAIVDALHGWLARSEYAEIMYHTEVQRLSLTADGCVNGVIARGPDGLFETLNGTAVVLACGGFEGNREMLARYLGPGICDMPLLAPGLAYNTGAGIRMAMEVGAGTSGQFDMVHSELVDRRTSRADAYLYGHPFGIVVNGDGKRFYDEGQGTFVDTFELIAFEVWQHQDQTAFFIADQTVQQQPLLMLLFDSDIPPVQADTIPELAVQLGLEPDVLVQTVEEFNQAVGPGELDFSSMDGKSTTGLYPDKTNWAYPLENPPFFAYPATTAICFTYGGLRTDTHARVLTANGVPIPGLYAAGEIVGVFYHEYPAGTSVLRSITFGRIAGTHAAEAAVG